MSDPVYEHALHEFIKQRGTAGETPGVSIELMPFLNHLNLRGDTTDEIFLQSCNSALQNSLPQDSNTFTGGDQHVFWLGPNEWLIVSDPARESLQSRLMQHLEGQHASVTDISGGQLMLKLTGPDVRNVLAKGCTLDFHARHFFVGQCAQSGLAKAAMLIAMIDDSPTFIIVVRRSFADYTARWLDHAGSEFGIAWSCPTWLA